VYRGNIHAQASSRAGLLLTPVWRSGREPDARRVAAKPALA
jgi:hypothetical protein